LIGAAGELLGVGSLNLQRRTRGGVTAFNMFVPSELLPPILDDLAGGKPPKLPVGPRPTRIVREERHASHKERHGSPPSTAPAPG
jgi:hypothetical protein